MKKILLSVSALVVVLGLAVQSVMACSCDSGGGMCHKGKATNQNWYFKSMDKNGDGVVSKAEAMENFEAKFNMKDANGDGKITKEEAEKYHQMRRERMMNRQRKMNGGM